MSTSRDKRAADMAGALSHRTEERREPPATVALPAAPVRVTADLPGDTHRALRHYAIDQGTSINAVLNALVESLLGDPEAGRQLGKELARRRAVEAASKRKLRYPR